MTRAKRLSESGEGEGEPGVERTVTRGEQKCKEKKKQRKDKGNGGKIDVPEKK